MTQTDGCIFITPISLDESTQTLTTTSGTKMNQTQIIVECGIINSTIYYCNDIVFDTSQFFAINIVALIALAIGFAIVWFLCNQVLSYLKNKVEARKSLIDIPCKVYFTHLKLVILVWFIRQILFNTFSVIENNVLVLLMWLTVASFLIFLIINSLSPIFQLILIKASPIELPFSDNTAELILYIACWTPITILCILCHFHKVYPPFYDILYHVQYEEKIKTKPLFVTILVLGITCLSLFIVVRFYIIKTMRNDNERDIDSNQLISLKTVLPPHCFSLVFLLIFWLSGNKNMSHPFVWQIFFNAIWISATTIIFHKKTRSHFISRNHVIVKT